MAERGASRAGLCAESGYRRPQPAHKIAYRLRETLYRTTRSKIRRFTDLADVNAVADDWVRKSSVFAVQLRSPDRGTPRSTAGIQSLARLATRRRDWLRDGGLLRAALDAATFLTPGETGARRSGSPGDRRSPSPEPALPGGAHWRLLPEEITLKSRSAVCSVVRLPPSREASLTRSIPMGCTSRSIAGEIRYRIRSIEWPM